jgi:hypothetical protein
MPLRFPPNKHPGPDGVYVICDVCGRKVRRKDTQLIRDKWNFQNGLVVCKWDVDNVNLQVLPYKHKEELVTSPETLRSEPSDTFATPETDDRTPSAPRLGKACPDTITGTSIQLNWVGPIDAGTSRITGYVIERATPQLSNYAAVTSDTGSNSTFYTDTTADVDTEYTYRIAAINGAGTGTYSEDIFYPTIRVPTDINYLSLSQNDNVLATSDGVPIVFTPNT